MFLFSVVLVFSMFSFVVAQEHDNQTFESDEGFVGDSSEDSGEFFDDNVVLEETEGITPDSALYFFDNFLDRFGDEVKVREEKIAEIRAMIREGKYDSAREALEKYYEYADALEREVSPEQREEARRSASAIRNALREIENEIPEEDRGDFVDDVISKEERIVTASEIAGKINELCRELSELDPLQYSRVCKADGDSPRWQQRLHRDLTDQQREEAEEFFEIMSQCFETSGAECRCQDISIIPFANKCSQIAPLAYACDVEGDEIACDKMDAIEDEEPIEDLLPDYLQDVLRQIEGRFEESEFDNHAPRECRESGATTREACMEIMFRLDAPPECVDAWEKGEFSLRSEREAREACDKIMFDLNAPQECLDEGLTDFRECGKLMFQLHAPQECLDAGLTGEHRSDERKCREIAGGEFGNRGPGGPRGGHIDFNCKTIENPEERLRCFDRAANQVDSQHGGFDDENYEGPCMTSRDWDNKKKECRNLYGEHAGDEPVYGDSGEGYECVIDANCVDFGHKGGDNPWEGCEALYCGPGKYCEYGQCKEFEGYVPEGEGSRLGEFGSDDYEGGGFYTPNYDCSTLQCGETEHCDNDRGCVPNEYAPGEGPGEPGDFDSSTDSSTTGPDAGTTDSTTKDSGSTDTGSTDSGSVDSGSTDSGTADSGDTNLAPTGSFIFDEDATGSSFLRHFFSR